jgi:E3 ubiquitin-protein ligase TTC3
MTDPVPVSENFKERYEMVLREKIDLRAKLEESEDRRFKLQRDHKRELERQTKTVRHEAREESQVKARELEAQVKAERERAGQERRETAEQVKTLKAEIKSLSDKVDRQKKDITRRDNKLENVYLLHQTDIERLSGERRKLEERLRLAQDHTHLAVQRAISAEVDILQLRVENVRRPGEARLMEIDRICSHLPPASDLHREWLAYQEKLRTALECFQMATEEQIQAVKSGRELSTMEKIPNPSVPLPAHLAFVSPPWP